MKNKNCFPKATTVRGEGNPYMSLEPSLKTRQIGHEGNMTVLRNRGGRSSIFFSLTYQKHGELSSNQTGRHCPSQAPSEKGITRKPKRGWVS